MAVGHRCCLMARSIHFVHRLPPPRVRSTRGGRWANDPPSFGGPANAGCSAGSGRGDRGASSSRFCQPGRSSAAPRPHLLRPCVGPAAHVPGTNDASLLFTRRRWLKWSRGWCSCGRRRLVVGVDSNPIRRGARSLWGLAFRALPRRGDLFRHPVQTPWNLFAVYLGSCSPDWVLDSRRVTAPRARRVGATCDRSDNRGQAFAHRDHAADTRIPTLLAHGPPTCRHATRLPSWRRCPRRRAGMYRSSRRLGSWPLPCISDDVARRY